MSLPRTRPLYFTVGVDGGSVRRSGSRLALGQRQRKEKQTKSTSTHVPPPQGLCGDRVFRLPEHSAGSTGPSTPAGPIRPTPVFRQISPGGGVLPLRRFSLPPAAAQKVNCPEGAREAPLEGSLLSRQKRMRGGSPAPTRPAGQGTAPDDTPPPPVPSSVRLSAVHLPPRGKAIRHGSRQHFCQERRPCGASQTRFPHPSFALQMPPSPGGGRLSARAHVPTNQLTVLAGGTSPVLSAKKERGICPAPSASV